jgi:prevent-host-death family protein
MCYSRGVERIALRELRNQASRIVRRARAGERLIITVDGVPAAQIVPLDPGDREVTMEELIAQGRLIAPRATAVSIAPAPVDLAGVRPLSDIVAEQRER